MNSPNVSDGRRRTTAGGTSSSYRTYKPFLVAVFLVGCAASIQRITTDREGTGTELGDACARLRAVGCPEGYPADGRTCFEHFTKRATLVTIPVACFASAGDANAARACGQERVDTTLRVKCLMETGDGGT